MAQRALCVSSGRKKTRRSAARRCRRPSPSLDSPFKLAPTFSYCAQELYRSGSSPSLANNKIYIYKNRRRKKRKKNERRRHCGVASLEVFFQRGARRQVASLVVRADEAQKEAVEMGRKGCPFVFFSHVFYIGADVARRQTGNCHLTSAGTGAADVF